MGGKDALSEDVGSLTHFLGAFPNLIILCSVFLTWNNSSYLGCNTGIWVPISCNLQLSLPWRGRAFQDGVRFVVVEAVGVFIVHFSRQCCWKPPGKPGLSVAKKQHLKVSFLVAEQEVMKEIYKKVILEQKLRQFVNSYVVKKKK